MDDLDILVSQLLEPAGQIPDLNRLITGIALGAAPGAELTKQSNQEPLTIFLDTAASSCEEAEIIGNAGTLVQSPLTTLRSSGFEGLAAATGDSIAPVDLFRYNIPPITAGTLGLVAQAQAGGLQYAVSSNHVLANNRRTPGGAMVFDPGLIGDPTGGAVVANYTDCVPLTPPQWPLRANTATRNEVDAAWAVLAPPLAQLPPKVTVPAAPVAGGTAVTKRGRTSYITQSKIIFRRWCGFVDFGFGTFYMVNHLLTWDPTGTQPFAEPGDSGSLVLETGSTTGVGLISARGYHYDVSGNFQASMILISPLEVILSKMGAFDFYGD